MRHLFGIVLGVVLAAALYIGGGWGFHRMFTMPNATHLTSARGLTSIGALLGTGLLLGVLMAAPRISPLSTALPGAAALAVTVLYVVSPHRALGLIPAKTETFSIGAHSLLVTGVYGLLGMAMLIPVFVPSRWRVPPREVAEDPMGMAAESSYLS